MNPAGALGHARRPERTACSAAGALERTVSARPTPGAAGGGLTNTIQAALRTYMADLNKNPRRRGSERVSGRRCSVHTVTPQCREGEC